MKELILRLAGTTILLAAVACQNQELVPATPGETPRLGVLAASTTQNVVGTVTDVSSNEPIPGAHVWFFDAFNAELLGEETTGKIGEYDSGPLPIGDIRVRLGGVAGTDGVYLPAFYGAEGFDDFCEGSVVTLAPSRTTVVDESLKESDPIKPVTYVGALGVLVLDGQTGDPVQGIQVDLRDAANTFVIASATTDEDGVFFQKAGPEMPAFRVRISDPSMTYLPQYYGASGLDVFCAATIVQLDDKGWSAKVLLERPPASLTETLIIIVDSFGLPDSEATMLAAPLARAVVLLNDGNSANDGAACGELRGFLSRIDVQERRGVLTADQADALRAQVATLQEALGCA